MELDDCGATGGAGPEGPARKELPDEGNGEPPPGLADVTAEELAAIKQFVAGPEMARRGGGRRFVMARLAFKIGGMLLLGGNVGVGLGDGNEFDQAGCSVAGRRAEEAPHGAKSGKAEEDADDRARGGGCGAAGACGSGGRPECEVRAERCEHRRPDGMCGRFNERCRLLAVRSVGRRYLLEKGLGGWRLVFDGRKSVLPDEKGVAYVAALLRGPPEEPIHGAELANRAFGDAIVDGQRNLAMDDGETMQAMSEARRRCQAVIDDAAASEVERREAEVELEGIVVWARRHLRGTEGSEQRQVRAIRQAIRRLLAGLRGSSDPVLVAFGEHLEKYLWGPSGRGGGGRDSRVRAGLAGRFTYEPPEGVRWC